MLILGKSLNGLPGTPRCCRIVIGLDHSFYKENSQAGFRIFCFRKSKVLCESPDLIWQTARFHMRGHLTHPCIKCLGCLMVIRKLKLRTPVQGVAQRFVQKRT